MIPWILSIIFFILNIILIVKIILYRHDTRKICNDLDNIIQSDTNNLLFTNTKDKYIKQLAKKLNIYLKDLKKEKQKYQNGNRELNDAIISISHDLKTPLTAIYGYLELLEQETTSIEVKNYLSQITNRTNAIKQLTDELFRYSIISSLDIENKEDLVLNKILEESIISYYGALQTRGITPIINICDEPYHIFADKMIITRIIDNIISNAVKYSEGDLYIDMDSNGLISFKNTAKELSQTEVCRLFERFYTVSTGRNSTGLGLAIAKMLTERMGKKIEALYQDNMLCINLYL